MPKLNIIYLISNNSKLRKKRPATVHHLWQCRLPNFTGIDSAYEAPENPEIVVDAGPRSADEIAEEIVAKAL